MLDYPKWSQIAIDVCLCLSFALLVWAPIGRSILAVIDRKSFVSSYVLAIPLGMGTLGLGILLLGLAGLLYPSLLAAVIVALLVGLKFSQNPDPPADCESQIRPKSLGWELCWIPGAMAVAYCLLLFGSTLAPEVAFDSLNVHLPYAREAAAAHRIGFSPNNWSSIMPALPLMNYIVAFLFAGVTLAKLFNWFCYINCGGVIYYFARRWWGPVHGAAASLLFLSSPVALYEASTALIDLPLTLFSAVAILSLLEWRSSGTEGPLRLSALALGFAFGCKYHAAFWFLPILWLLAWQTIRTESPQRRALIKMIVGFCLIAFTLCLPWLIRAWYYTGNPVFPMANGIFKSLYFTPAMEAAAQAAYENEGVGRSVKALLQLPWTVSVHPGPFRGTLGFVFLPGIVLALVRSKTRQVRWAAFLAAAYFYAWAVTAQEIRYLLPLLPLLSVLAAVGFLGTAPILSACVPPTANSWAVWRKLSAGLGLLVILMAGIAAFPPVYPRLVKDWTYWHSYQSPLPFLLGRQSTQEFLSRDVPSIYVYDFVNRHLGPSDRILLLNDASQFYSEVPTLYSFTVEAEKILLQQDENQLLEKLKESRISHVLLNYNGIAPLRGVEPRQGVYLFLDKTFRERHLELQYSRNNVILYRVRSS